MPSDADESVLPGEEAEAHALRLAAEKARLTASKAMDGLVIGADTIVVLNGKIFGKPSSPCHAKEMLRALSGKTHEVMTAFALVDAASKAELKGIEKTAVSVKELTDREIDDYVATGEPLDKAGAYAVQGTGAFMVTRVDGSYTNVVGLPMERIREALERAGLLIKPGAQV
jgi:septum formation protein